MPNIYITVTNKWLFRNVWYINLRTLKNKHTKDHLCLFCARISHLQLNKYLKSRKQINAINFLFSFKCLQHCCRDAFNAFYSRFTGMFSNSWLICTKVYTLRGPICRQAAGLHLRTSKGFECNVVCLLLTDFRNDDALCLVAQWTT